MFNESLILRILLSPVLNNVLRIVAQESASAPLTIPLLVLLLRNAITELKARTVFKDLDIYVGNSALKICLHCQGQPVRGTHHLKLPTAE